MSEELVSLKAKAYDLIFVMEKTQKELDGVNRKIAQLLSQPSVEAQPEEKKE